jgi:hypothetical protein
MKNKPREQFGFAPAAFLRVNVKSSGRMSAHYMTIHAEWLRLSQPEKVYRLIYMTHLSEYLCRYRAMPHHSFHPHGLK